MPTRFGSSLLHAMVLAAALVGPAAAPAQEAAEQPAQEAAEEATLPDGVTLDLSTPTPEELQAAKRARALKPFANDPRSEISTKVGVDYRKAAIPGAEFQPEQLLSGVTPDQANGVAWATLTAGVPIAWDKASIDTRVDPLQEQGKVATTLSRSVPVGDALSVTLQNGVEVSRTLANPAPSSQPTAPSQSWSSSQAVKFNILPTDTTVSLGANLSSTGDKWLRSLSAEQKLFGGPVSVTGAVSETPTGEASKSLKAGFKRTW
jgi:hypothetical protein